MSAMDDYYAMLQAQAEQMLSLNDMGNSQQQWEAHVNQQSGVMADVQGEDDSPRRTGNEVFAQKNRILAGGTGDIAQMDKSGNITGYTPRVKAGGLTPGLDKLAGMKAASAAGAPLSTASATPGLDKLHKANPLLMPSFGPQVVKTNTQFGPTAKDIQAPMVTKKYTLPAQNTAEMAKKIFS